MGRRVKWRLVVAPKIHAKLPHLPRLTKRYVRQAFNDICQDPWTGKPLRDELVGFHSYRVRRFRVVYQIFRSAATVRIIGVGPRETIYQEVAEEQLQEYTDQRLKGFLSADRKRSTPAMEILDRIRRKVKRLGIGQKEMQEAIRWIRKQRRVSKH